MNGFFIWAGDHRVVLIGLISLVLWAAAYIWYGQTDLARIRNEKRPHAWTVDMANRTSKGGKKSIN